MGSYNVRLIATSIVLVMDAESLDDAMDQARDEADMGSFDLVEADGKEESNIEQGRRHANLVVES